MPMRSINPYWTKTASLTNTYLLHLRNQDIPLDTCTDGIRLEAVPQTGSRQLRVCRLGHSEG
jgi:hypothetical protein